MNSKFRDDLSVVIGTATDGDRDLKFPFYISGNTALADIEILSLSPRSHNALRRSKVNTIGAVVDVFDSLGSLRNVGAISVKEIRQRVCDFLYDAMSVNERKTFWKEFIQLNNVKGLA